MASRQEHEQYWLRRTLANQAKSINYTEAKLAGLKRHYTKATATINHEVKSFYDKYGVDGKVDITTASAYTKDRLTRLDELKQRIQSHYAAVIATEEKLTKSILIATYEGGYYRTVFDIDQFRGWGKRLDELSFKAVDQAISTAWSGASYSERIWKRQRNLSKSLDEIMTQGVLLGHSNDKMAKQLADRMNVSFSHAKRLIRTETNYVHNAAGLKGYEAAGVEEYQYLATLDMRTSVVCQQLDGKVFKVRDAQVGLNCPPLHPNCRSTTIPYFEDAVDTLRVARDAEGNNIDVPGDMTYAAWRNSLKKAKLGLSYHQEAAIMSYIGGESYLLNEKLRQEVPLSLGEATWAMNLDEALEKLPHYEGDLSRSLYFATVEQLERFLQDYTIGAVLQYNEYLSTTSGSRYNDLAQVQLYILNASLGRDMTLYNPEEAEVIYPRGAKFKVLEVMQQHHIYHILLEELKR